MTRGENNAAWRAIRSDRVLHRAASIAYTFHLDPLTLLGPAEVVRRIETEDHEFCMMVRAAANDWVREAEEKAAKP